MRRLLRSCIRGLILAVLLPLLPVAASAADKPTGPETIKQTDPSFFVKVDVDKPSRNYREGDPLAISVVCEQDAYIYVLYKQADGKVYQIFPNSGQTENHLKAKTKAAIPAADDLFRWKVGAPFGKEFLKVIAVKEPLKELDDPKFRAERFNAVPAQTVKDLRLALNVVEPKKWAEDQVELTTHDASWTPPPPPNKRFGVFFGVGKYAYDDLYKAGLDNKDTLERSSNRDDAIVLQEILKRFGKLDDSRVYLDERATRQSMEEAITQWLPTVSQPGDTVFVFFGGHGDALIDKRTGHAGLTYLLPHEFVGSVMVGELLKRKQNGTITADESSLLQTWASWMPGVQSFAQMNEILARRTGIPDDLFGHWLQRLAGRQIVLLFGACHSGGFAAEGKGLEQRDVALEFLNRQIERLNDLGQGEIALLAACGSKETSLSFRVPDDKLKSLRSSLKGVVDDALPDDVMLSVYTYYIVDGLMTDPAPTRIETIFDGCRNGTAEYLAKLNAKNRRDGRPEIKPYAPQLFNHCTKPVILKLSEAP